MSLSLHEVHQSLGASFTTINGLEAVAHYIDPAAEYRWIQNAAGVIDLDFADASV